MCSSDLKLFNARGFGRSGRRAGKVLRHSSHDSNPGAAALNAVLNPKGDYLYYLSTRDGSRMIFSKTGAEHEANRKKHLGL